MWGISSVSSGQSSCFAWVWVCIWYISQCPLLCVHVSLSQDGFCSKEVYVTSPTMGWCPPFMAPEETFCACVVRKVFLTSGMRNMWSLFFFLLLFFLLGFFFFLFTFFFFLIGGKCSTTLNCSFYLLSQILPAPAIILSWSICPQGTHLSPISMEDYLCREWVPHPWNYPKAWFK